MDTYHLISQISMKIILEKLGIRFSNMGFNTLRLWKDDDLTSGWTLNVSENYVNDFSKDRAIGGPFTFVKSYLKFSDKETFDRFSRYFDIQNKNRSKNKTSYKKRETARLPKYNHNR